MPGALRITIAQQEDEARGSEPQAATRPGPVDFLFPQLIAEVRALGAIVKSFDERHSDLVRMVRRLESSSAEQTASSAEQAASLTRSVEEAKAQTDNLARGLEAVRTSMGSVGERLAAQEISVGQNLNDLIGGFGRLDTTMVQFGGLLNDLIGGFGRLDATMVNFGQRLDTTVETLAARLAQQETSANRQADNIISGFGRLDTSVVALGAQLENTMVTFAARVAAQETSTNQGIADLVRGFGRLDQAILSLDERVAPTLNVFGQRLEAQEASANKNVHDLINGFGRLDSSIVAFGTRMDAFDVNLGKGIDTSLKTIWEAKAALSAELKDVPQQLADAGIGGGGLGRSEDGVAVGDLLFPQASRADVEHIDLAKAMREYGEDNASLAAASTKDVVAALKGVDLSPMARNSPELKGMDWQPYIELSAIRVARTLAALKKHAPENARLLDFGSYFGNFSLALARAGYRVDAVDAYSGPFGGAMAPFAKLMREAGAKILDVAEVGYDFAGVQPSTYDVVIFMGAIEHVPHTPRVALEAINRVLKPGGLLVLDTPNLGYVYNRRKFVSGRSVFPPIEHQFETEIPFFGHHREYLLEEVTWMLERVGHEIIETDMFNYSMFGMSELRGEHLAMWRLMQQHPQLRELIFTVSRKR